MQTLNVLFLLVIFGFGAAAMQTTPNNQPDRLAGHPGDMPEGTYYAGDVVARYASEKETVTAYDMASPEQKIMLADLARHMGRKK